MHFSHLVAALAAIVLLMAAMIYQVPQSYIPAEYLVAHGYY